MRDYNEITKAASTAAKLAIMVLSPEYNSQTALAIRKALENGIELKASYGKVSELFEELGLDTAQPKVISIDDLVERNPQAWIDLCNTFCEAIEVGADGDEYERLRGVAASYRDRSVSATLAEMNAPKAAEFFSLPTLN